MATGPHPRYVEELRVGGGYGDPEDGGAEIAKNGDMATDGALTVKGVLAAGAAPQAVTNSDGEVLGGRIAAQTVARAQLANDAVDGTKLDEAASYVVAGIDVTGDAAAGGRVSARQALQVFDPSTLGTEQLANGAMEGPYADGLAAHWEEIDGLNRLTPSEETTDVYAGSSCQRIVIQGGAANMGIRSDPVSAPFALSKGKWYRLQFAVKVVSGCLSSVRIGSSAGYQHLYYDAAEGMTTGGVWAVKTMDFQATFSAADGALWFSNVFWTPVELLLDAVSLKEIGAGDLQVAGDAIIGGHLQCAGDGNFDGNLTASSYADNSPVYVGGAALAVIKGMGAEPHSTDKDGFARVDHRTLGPLLAEKTRARLRCRVTGDICDRADAEKQYLQTGQRTESREDWVASRFEPVAETTAHRDLGRQVQVNSAAVLELLARVEALEAG